MAAKFKNYYETLGVSSTATEDEIRKSFRNLARKHHPDVNPGDKSAENRFKEINEAYEVLSDPEKRKKYDQFGADWKTASQAGPPPGWQNGPSGSRDFSEAFGEGATGSQFSDFFESLFGSQRSGRRGQGFRMRGEDIDAELLLTLEEAHRGGTRTLSLTVQEPCADCGGTGLKDGKTCPTCRGAGVVPRTKSLEVKIPAGIRENSVIRLAGQGEPGAMGGPPGDLHLHVRLEPHPLFEIVGQDDIQVEVPVAPWEAVLGANVVVPTLESRIEMTIPAGTQAGRRLRLKGQGLNKRNGGRGDEYVKARIVVPPKPTAKERELFEALATASRFDARQLMNKGG